MFFSLAGKAYFAKGDRPSAASSYEQAASLAPASAAPWKGLAELATAAGDARALAAALEKVLELSGEPVDDAAKGRLAATAASLAAAREAVGAHAAAATSWRQALDWGLPGSDRGAAIMGEARSRVAAGEAGSAAATAALAAALAADAPAGNAGLVDALARHASVTLRASDDMDAARRAATRLAGLAPASAASLSAALDLAADAALAGDAADPASDAAWIRIADALTALDADAPAAVEARAQRSAAHRPNPELAPALKARDPPSPAALITSSHLFFALGFDLEAGKAARAALRALKARGLQTCEAALAARALAARAKAAAGETDGARTDWATVLERSPEGRRSAPGSAARLARRGLARLLAADSPAVLQELHALTEPPAAEHWAWGDLGRALLAAGDGAAAADPLRNAVKAAEREATAAELEAHRLHLGRALASSGDREGAARAWLAAAAVAGPARGPAFAELGFSYRDKGDEPRAIACWTRAVDADPRQERAARAAVAAARAAGDPARAAAVARRVADADPRAAWAWREVASTLTGDSAVAAWQGALRADGGDARSWAGLGGAYAAAGRPAAAGKAYGRAADLLPTGDSAGAHAAACAARMAVLCSDWVGAGERADAAAGTPAADAAAADAPLGRALDATHAGEPGAAAAWAAASEAAARGAAAAAPTAAAPLKAAGDAALVVAAVGSDAKDPEAWRGRLAAAVRARRAHAGALFRAPAAAGAWGDAAASLAAAAAALRSAPGAHADSDALLVSSTRCLRAGLRLNGADALLWSALGRVPTSPPPAREAALARALALDPRDGSAWADLVRLHGAEADAALAAARSRAPADAAVWAAAGAVAPTPAAAADAYEHALTLGGGVEASLAVAEAAWRGGGWTPRAAAAASRAAAARPDCGPARAAAGAAALAAGDAGAAEAHWRAAVALLSVDQPPAWAAAGAPSPATVARVGLHRCLAATGRPEAPSADDDPSLPPADRLAAARATAAATGDLAPLLALADSPEVGAEALRCSLGARVAAGPGKAASAAASVAAAAARLPPNAPRADALREALVAAACIGGTSAGDALTLAALVPGAAPAEAAAACLSAAADAATAAGKSAGSLLARAAHACPWEGEWAAAAAAARGLAAAALAHTARGGADRLADLPPAAVADASTATAAAATLSRWPPPRPAAALRAAAAATPAGAARLALLRRAAHAAPWEAGERRALLA